MADDQGAAMLAFAAMQDGSGASDLALSKVLIAFGVIVAESLFSRQLGLGIADQLLIAGIRAMLQLLTLGFVLGPIFKSESPTFVFGYIFGFMVLVSAYEAAARPKIVYAGICRNAAVSIGVPVMTMMCVLWVIVAPTPWFNPQYLIPMAGMLISNALTGVAPAANLLIDYLTTRKEQVQLLLAFGATPREATWPAVTQTFRQALIPSINSMNVIGIVAIPGMMTGQVLGGSSPEKAARYQIVITFLISGCVMMSVYFICSLTISSVFDDRGRLASDRLVKQTRLKIAQLFSGESCRGCWSRRGGKPAEKTTSRTGNKDAPLLDGMEAANPLHLRAEQYCCDVGGSDDFLLKVHISGCIANARKVEASIDLHAGEVAAIVGPSGVGKSTLCKMISDLLPCDAGGTLLVNGKASEGMPGSSWRRQVLYVPQGVKELEGSPKEFVDTLHKLRINKGRPPIDVEEFMGAFGLSKAFLDRSWGELSGGEAQRMMLAIALATKPSCLLLDEPTSALDDVTKSLVEAKIKSLGWPCSIVIVSHDAQQVARVSTSVWRLSE